MSSSLASETAYSASAKHVECCRHFHYGSGLSTLLDKATPFPSFRFSKPDGRMAFNRTHMGHAHDHQEHKHNDDTGEAGERVSRLGLIADICLTVGKGFAGYASGSTAVIADAAHSMSDVVSLFRALRLCEQTICKTIQRIDSCAIKRYFKTNLGYLQHVMSDAFVLS